MEETLRTHKDVPFGWFDLLLKAVARGSKPRPRTTRAAAARSDVQTLRGRTT